MRLVLLALALCACSHWRAGEFRRIGDTSIECAHSASLGHPHGDTQLECRAIGDPRTARKMSVGAAGETLQGEVRGAIGFTP